MFVITTSKTSAECASPNGRRRVPPLTGNAGITLIEVTMAVAVFTIALGLGAQAIMANHAALDMQEQRIEGIQACRAVLGELREARAQFRDGDDFNMGDYLDWVEDQNDSNWETYLRTADKQLPNHSITVTCMNMQGGPAGNNDSLIEVHAISSWTDRSGRPMSARVATLLSDR